ncbi:MAG: hypothetical protein GY720_02045, partial [bacterium]|nr:hypothetical protein [bacterium]
KALEEKVGAHYGWSAEDSAANMYMVALSSLMMAMRIQTVARGWDPRDFAIVPYGGGGALYACDLAWEIGVGSVIVPPLPGYASAFGAIRVDVKHEFTHPIHKVEDELEYDWLNDQMDTLAERARATLAKEGVPEDMITIGRYADVKYFSQSRFFTVEVADGRIDSLDPISQQFMDDMKAEYGYNLPPGYTPMEVVNLRVIARGEIVKPDLPKLEPGGSLDDARKPSRQVWFKDSGFIDADIYERGRLPAGAKFDGPAIIEQPDTTTVMPPGTHCTVDEYSNLIIKVDR